MSKCKKCGETKLGILTECMKCGKRLCHNCILLVFVDEKHGLLVCEGCYPEVVLTENVLGKI